MLFIIYVNFTNYFFHFFHFVLFAVNTYFYDDLDEIKSSSFPILIAVHPQIPDWVCQYHKQNKILEKLIEAKKRLESKSNRTIFFGDYCNFVVVSLVFLLYFFLFLSGDNKAVVTEEVDVEVWYERYVRYVTRFKAKLDGHYTKRIIEVSSMKIRKELDAFEVNFVVFLFNSQINEMKINF